MALQVACEFFHTVSSNDTLVISHVHAGKKIPVTRFMQRKLFKHGESFRPMVLPAEWYAHVSFVAREPVKTKRLLVRMTNQRKQTISITKLVATYHAHREEVDIGIIILRMAYCRRTSVLIDYFFPDRQ